MQRKKTVSKKPKVVYTYGVFDLFHRGHVQLLKDAKALGDELVVGLFNDKVVESFKRKPVIPLADRLHMVKHCKFVDRTVIQHHLSPEHVIRKIKPHVLAKGPGAGWKEHDDVAKAPGAEAIRKLGGKVVKLRYHNGISTSEIIKKIKKG